jgi:hypothetical protein
MLFRNKNGMLLAIERNKFNNDNDYYKAIISFKNATDDATDDATYDAKDIKIHKSKINIINMLHPK